MVTLSQTSTVDNSANPRAAAAGGVDSFPAPTATLVAANRYPTGGSGAVIPRSYTTTTTDAERNTTVTQVTVEHVRVPGMVITTTTKVQFDHPGHFLNANHDAQPATPNTTNPTSTPRVTVATTGTGYDTYGTDDGSDESDSDNYSMDDDSIVDAYMVPSPAAYTRPANQTDPFYVIFAGREVGIVQGEWDAVVRQHCLGVRHARNVRYESWDDALYQYTRAYQGRRDGWAITPLEVDVPVIRDTSYTWSQGPAPGVEMLGVVDITGLDINRDRVTKIART